MKNENLFNSTVNFYNINNENFIDFLYSKEVIAGLNPDTQLKFEMSEVEGKKTIGSGHEITIKDFLEYVWRELKTKATEKWMEEHEKNELIQ